MSDLHVDPKDPYKGIKINPISEKKSVNDQDQTFVKSKKNFKIIAAVCFLFQKQYKKLINRFSKNISVKKLLNLVNIFRLELEKLKEGDYSQDLKFLNNISSLWIKISDEVDLLPKNNSLKKKLNEIFNKILNYPTSEFSLGFYLYERAGYEWIPFPYMKIIKNIYEEYIEKQKDSNLHRWIMQLKEILQISNYKT